MREMVISLDGVRDKNVMQLKKLNTALFPVRYNDKYYTDALSSGEFTKLGTNPNPNPNYPRFCLIVLRCFDFSNPQLITATFAWDPSLAGSRRRREGPFVCIS